MKVLSPLSCLICCLLGSCSKNISIPLPPEEIRPALNAMLCEDSVIYARATLSDRLTRNDFLASPNGFDAPENAVIQLFEEDHYLEDLQPVFIYDQRFFNSTHKMKQGKKYTLRLNIPGYDVAEASDIIPDKQRFDLSDMHIFMTNTSYGYQETNLSFSIKNKDEKSNYYLFRLYSLYNYVSMENTGKMLTWIDYKHNAPDILGGTNQPQELGLLSGKPIAAGASSLFTLTAGLQFYDTMLLEVSVLTESCYQYKNTYQKAIRSMDDPTAEKINVYSNVSSGFGIVGGMATKTYLLSR